MDSGNPFEVQGTPAMAAAAAGAGGAGGLLAGDHLPEVVSGTNPLTTAANPLLNLIPQIRATAQHPDPGQLREFLVGEIQAFEVRARNAGITPEVIVGARYCLCTALDETVAQTPWGGSGAWSQHGLLITFHREAWGGEKFFQLLSKLAQNPQQHAHLLELMYYCLVLGFEGRFKIVDNGRTQLETLRARLAHIVRQNRGEYEPPLSQHWLGVPAPVKKPWESLPLWVAAAIFALLALGLYFWLKLLLGGQAEALAVSIHSIDAPKVTVTRKTEVVVPRLRRFLEPEIREGLVKVDDLADRSIVTLQGDGLFDSAKTTVKPKYLPVIARIAAALQEVPGRVVVTGYTDDVPIRFPFASNFELSQARADAVKQMLDASLRAPDRVQAQGQGAQNPVAPNDSAENRARNRRVEITLLVPPPETAAALQTPPAQAPAPAGVPPAGTSAPATPGSATPPPPVPPVAPRR